MTKFWQTIVFVNGLALTLSLASGARADNPIPVNIQSEKIDPNVGVIKKENDGERALDLGEYTRAESIFSEQLKASGKNDPDRGYMELGLSEALLNQGRFSEAAKEYKKAQSLIETDNKPSEIKARMYDGLSWLYHGQGKLDEAMSWAQKSIATRKAIDDPSLLLLVASLTHLGQMSELLGKLSDAGQYYQQALALQDQKAGPGTLVAADLQEDLGSCLRRLGNVDGANQCFRAALQAKLGRQAPTSQYSPHPYWETVTFPFLDSSPNCAKRFEQGAQEEMITANGVTVVLSLEPVESSKSTQARVYVKNETNAPISFLPIPPSLTVTSPKIYLAPQVDPNKLATSVQKKGDRKAAWIRFWGNNATQTMTSTCIGQPGFFGYPPVYGYGGYSSGNYSSWYNRSGNMTIMTQNIPNYLEQQRAFQRAAEVSGQARQNADAIKTSGLGPTTIPPGQTVTGGLFFDAPKITNAVARIPIGNAIFEFHFPPR